MSTYVYLCPHDVRYTMDVVIYVPDMLYNVSHVSQLLQLQVVSRLLMNVY